jgi:hypothetical protein
MVEIVTEATDAAGETADAIVKIPSGAMRIIRQSYDSRERVLDWMLAIFVAAALVYVFKAQLMGMFVGDPGPNAGLPPVFAPNQNVGSAFPNDQYAPAYVYTYNMPSSRSQQTRFANLNTRKPHDPGQQPQYPDLQGD